MNRVWVVHGIAFLALAGLAYGCQIMTFLNGDVGSLLYDARLFWAGGNYVKDFFETNPPMIFMIYSPVVFITQWFTLSPIMAVRCYILVLAGLSLGICFFQLDGLQVSKPFKTIILWSLALVFLFLPSIEFGQREHIFLMIFMPYILLVALRIEDKKITKKTAMLIGFLAALGLGMKPYFLAPWVLMEGYLIYRRKQALAWFRAEAIICLLVLLVYVGGTYQYCSDYFHVVLPLVSHLYYLGIEQDWLTIFSLLSVDFCIFVCAFSLFYFFSKKPSSLVIAFTLALAGSIIAFLITKAPWYYHVYPAIGMAALVLVAGFYPAFEKKNKTEILFLLLLAFAVPSYTFYVGMHMGIYVKKKSSLNAVIHYINQEWPAASIYCFSPNTTGDCFTLMYHTKSTYGGRYPFFWWMSGLLRMEKKGHLPEYIQRDKNYFIQGIVDDLNLYQPRLLIINKTIEKLTDFYFIPYLSQNRAFLNAWQPYHYNRTIGSFDIYKRA